MKNFHVLLWLLFFLGSVMLPEKSHAQLKTYQFEEIDSLQIIEKRKIVIFIHTDWCKYCQAMKNTTLKNKDIIDLLNERFYFIDFDAEEKRTIQFNNTKFKYKPTGIKSGINELAIELGTSNNQINYPTLCILNEKKEIIFQLNNFINSKDFKLFLGKIDN